MISIVACKYRPHLIRRGISVSSQKSFFKFAEESDFITNRRVEVMQSNRMGYGLRANSDVKKGEILVSVASSAWKPYSVASSIEYVKQYSPDKMESIVRVVSTISRNKGIKEELEQVISLSSRIMHGIEDGSDKYLNYVRESIATSNPHVLRMDEAWLQLLKGTQCENGINLRRQMFDMLSSTIFPGKEDEFKQAVGVILSRGLSGKNMPLTLVPYLDLANHSSAPNAEHYFDTNTQVWHLTALSDIVKGDEVLISYGSRRNTNSFVYLYGFAPQDNFNDAVTLQAPIKAAGDWRKQFVNVSPDQSHGIIEIPVQVFATIPKCILSSL